MGLDAGASNEELAAATEALREEVEIYPTPTLNPDPKPEPDPDPDPDPDPKPKPKPNPDPDPIPGQVEDLEDAARAREAAIG